MNLLRRPVRQQATGGGWMYATVEEFIKGRATVRLGKRGTRMTMLPVMSKRVSPGDRVIVDYSAEGQPYVRPLTSLPEEPELPEGISAPEEVEETGIIAAKLGTDGPQPFEPAYINMPHTLSRFWNPVELNRIYWESQPGLTGYTATQNIRRMHGLYFKAPELGKYLVKWCIAIEYHPSAPIWNTASDYIDFHVYGCHRKRARISGIKTDGDVTLVTISANYIQQLGDYIHGWGMYLPDIGDFDLAGIPQYTDEQWYASGSTIYDFRLAGYDISWAYKENCYPVLEVWKVSEVADTPHANMWWHWYDEVWS